MIQHDHTTHFRIPDLFWYVHLRFFILCFFGSVIHVSATHIVGGIITYVHDSGSTYTITLKLYRDCCPSCAALPATVTINVQQPDGSEFVPSKDFTISLGPVTNLPSNLDTCAIPPNPMPCVQEAIYSTTVTNLPPNPGGYHIYSQYCCRNLSTTNADMSCNCIGESFYAFIPGTTPVWIEYVNLANGITSDNDTTAWSSFTGAPPPASASVNNNFFLTTGADNGQATWASEYIDISSFPFGVDVKVDLSESGTIDADDTIRIYYRINNGPLILFTYNGFLADDFGNAMASDSGLTGDSIQIVVQFDYGTPSPNTEIYIIDNVTVAVNDFQTNNDPVFNSFPPLFLCVGQNFTIDHSATDTDGDSLVYSFYNPFTDDPPSYSGIQAIFTPITWNTGYSSTSPLNAGGPALIIDPVTGLLSGVANTLGQYIVGIKVTEYRNGVKISETIRDFQFNIAFCGFPGEANIDTTGDLYVCNGYSYIFPNQSDSAANNWWWNFGDPSTAADTSVLEFPTYTYPDTGDYYVTLITNKGTMCADTAYDTVHVSWVVADFIPDTIKCAGDTVNFTDLSVVSANDQITGWSWNFGDATNSSLQNPGHIYTDSGTYTVTLVVSTALGCTDTISQIVTILDGPVFIVDMTGSPDSIWVSPSIKRDCQVCGAVSPDVCVTFILTLDSGTQMISFNIASGAVPPGALYYEIGCANPTEVGDSICINGVGPHQLTFCKPGNNPNTYSITAIPRPSAGGNIVVTDACVDTLMANGFNEWTINWTSVYPGATGAYDIYLSCSSGCDTTVVTAQPGYPTYIDYRVCGSPAGGCYTDTVCDTARVYFVTSLFVDILPQNPTICFGGTNTTITATLTGGAPPYSYLWNTGATTQSISVGVGTYSIMAQDSLGCPPVYDTVTVTAFLSPIAADAGPNQLVCATTPVSLSGSVTAASGGTWSGGGGTFSPSADSLNTSYYPTAGEITSGAVTLYLTTTGNGSCPADTDTVIISFYSLTSLTLSSTPVSCAGGSDGTITAFPVGGNPPITYQWSDPLSQTTQTATGLIADTFMVTVTDADNCSITATGILTQADTISIAPSVTNATCFSLCNGTASTTVTGGVGSYSYSWSNGSTNSSAFGLCAGAFTVTVTDSNGCTMTASVNITQPPVAVSVSVAATNTSCYGLCDGSITASGSGGTGTYTFDWSNGMNGTTISGLCPGSFSVTVTDANGCTSVTTTSITEPAAVMVTTTVSNVSCNGSCSGSITATGSGGTGSYSFNWNNGMTGTTISNLCPENYSVTITDANGCTDTIISIIAEPAPLNAVIAATNINCYGLCTGTADVTASGGTPSYSYLWSNGETNIVNQGLCAASYTVTVTDANSCTVSDSILVTQPIQPIDMNLSVSNVKCFNDNDGYASVSPSNGVPPYTYQWDTAAGSQTDSIATGLYAGTYSVTVFDSYSCAKDTQLTLTQPSTALSMTTDSTEVTCYGGNDGTATVNVSGGIPPYSYQWDSAAGGQTTSTATGLSVGTYFITITDSCGCRVDSISVTITSIPEILLTFTYVNVSCTGGSDGTATVTPSGGTPPFTYQWDSASGLQTDSLATGLAAGTYAVTVTDNSNCAKEYLSVIIAEPQPVILTSASDSVNCYGGSDGNASIISSGGTPPYSYQWDTAASMQTDSLVTGLSAGIYSVTVTDNNGCQKIDSITVNQPAAPLSDSIISQNVGCKDGNDAWAAVTASGGTTTYQYLWSDSLATTTDTVTGLIAGTYTVTITDFKGCTISTSVNITEPADSLSVTSSQTNVSCFGGTDGSATVTASGGTPAYTYLWNNGDTTSSINLLPSSINYVTITDSNNCSTADTIIIMQPDSLAATVTGKNASCYNGSDGTATLNLAGGTPPYSYQWDSSASSQTSSTATGLSAGNYYASVTDSLNCKIDSIPVMVNQPPDIVLLLQKSDVSCKGGNNGTLTVTATGGNGGWQYSWNTIPLQDSTTATGLVSGTYTVIVTDSLSCSDTATINITEPSDSLSVSLSVSNLICYGDSSGSATATPSGGTTPYSYQWNTGSAQSSVTGLLAGTYSVTVNDTNGCLIADTNIIITQPSQVIVTAMGSDTICPGDAAIISSTASGGGGSYVYVWNGGASSGAVQTVTPGINTSYSVTATDISGCSSIPDTVTVSVRNLYFDSLNIYSSGNICEGSDDFVTIYGTYTEEFPPYTYSWNQGLGNELGPFAIIPQDTTLFILTVTDLCGNSIADSLTVYVYPLPEIALPPIGGQGCAPLTVSFSDTLNQNATWLWDFGDGATSAEQNPVHTFAPEGIYRVSLTVTSQYNCTSVSATSSQVTVLPPPQPLCNAVPPVTPINKPVISFNVTNAVSYHWEFGDGDTSDAQSPSHMFPDTGDYLVTVRVVNEYSCPGQCSLKVRISPVWDIRVPNAFIPDPAGPNGGVYSFDDFSNKVFFPVTRYVKNFHMMIFNRWGELIFESFDIKTGWDGYYRGKLCQQDVYVWKIYVKFADDSETEITRAGDVTLLR